MQSKVARLFMALSVTGFAGVFSGGCGSIEPAEKPTAEEAAQLYKSTKQALRDVVVNAYHNQPATPAGRALIDLPFSFALDCPTSGTISCDGNASVDFSGAALNFAAGATACTVYDGISMDGALDFSLTAKIISLTMVGTAKGSMTFVMGLTFKCDVDIGVTMDTSLDPVFTGTFCGFSVDILNQLI